MAGCVAVSADAVEEADAWCKGFPAAVLLGCWYGNANAIAVAGPVVFSGFDPGVAIAGVGVRVATGVDPTGGVGLGVVIGTDPRAAIGIGPGVATGVDIRVAIGGSCAVF